MNEVDEIRDIKSDIKTIKENHLYHIEKSMATMEADIAWIKSFFYIIATSSIGGLITSLFTLITP